MPNQLGIEAKPRGFCATTGIDSGRYRLVQEKRNDNEIVATQSVRPSVRPSITSLTFRFD